MERMAIEKIFPARERLPTRTNLFDNSLPSARSNVALNVNWGVAEKLVLMMITLNNSSSGVSGC